MELIWYAVAAFDLFLLYYFFVRGFVFARTPHECKRCGWCCRLRVTPTAQDIERIEKAGHNKADFLDAKGNLKRSASGFCTFFAFDKGKATCSIHGAKPKVCAGWPNGKIFGVPHNDIRCSQYKRKLF